jgi:transcriptional repressor NrdR
MRCNECRYADTKVIESRDVTDNQAIRRRRVCIQCGYRFTTYERVERPQLIVVKNDGTRQIFNRQKLLDGLYRACEKTPVSALQLDRLVAEIEQQLYACGDSEIASAKVGELVMDRLMQLNEVAYVRFASVYRRFKNITCFEKELSHIKQYADQKKE